MYTGIRQFQRQWVRAYQYVMPRCRCAIVSELQPPRHSAENRRPHLDSAGRRECYVYNFAYSYDATTPFRKSRDFEEIHFARTDDLLPTSRSSRSE